MISETGCRNYIIFCQDPEVTGIKIGHAIENKVFIITIGSSWQIREFFSSHASKNMMNLLVASAGQALQEKNKNVIKLNNKKKLMSHKKCSHAKLIHLIIKLRT